MKIIHKLVLADLEQIIRDHYATNHQRVKKIDIKLGMRDLDRRETA
jgi:hypothetical protein